MSDKVLRVGQNACDLTGINFEHNAYRAFPAKADSRLPTEQKETIIYLDLNEMTPDEILEAYALQNKILRRICGS